MTRIFYCTMALFAAAFCGCAFERHYSIVPGENQVVEVASGDRWYFNVDEDGLPDHEWMYLCNDSDIEVQLIHVPGKAKILIRVHRGYDGPSTVQFYQRGHKKNKSSAPPFTITLFKRTGDEAFWK